MGDIIKLEPTEAVSTENETGADNIYYDNANRGFRAHDYLGLYKDKSVRAIGKICARMCLNSSQPGTDGCLSLICAVFKGGDRYGIKSK